jgi:hypothetical protein
MILSPPTVGRLTPKPVHLSVRRLALYASQTGTLPLQTRIISLAMYKVHVAFL